MKPFEGLFGKLTAAALLTLCGTAVLAGTSLRETPIFWRHAGGYPEALRYLLLYTFYPLYALYSLCLLAASLMLARRLLARQWPGLVLTAACCLNWLLFVVITTWVVWNNVDNLLNGRALHYHPPLVH